MSSLKSNDWVTGTQIPNRHRVKYLNCQTRDDPCQVKKANRSQTYSCHGSREWVNLQK
ncbi:unnamed protein product [Hymenolepis diminuta]|uniref:Uncharacterized protein n=1 Tax=Hymenolepis diminuta TaxID=6216 RepID=A0A3P6ZQ54_HYMDI|nr:unnamed protein product [Hymenolepis diminuta]